MLFQVYGENAMYQWLGCIMVFVSLIDANEDIEGYTAKYPERRPER